MSESSSKSKYVPPHLRSRTGKASDPQTVTTQRPGSRDRVNGSGPSSSYSGSAYQQPGSNRSWTAQSQGSSSSRTSWSHGGQDPSPAYQQRGGSHDTGRWGQDTKHASRGARDQYPGSGRPSAYSGSGSGSNSRTPHTSPTLHVFGDSFVGPFKLLSDDGVKFQTFKGSSAKGLNNPKSLKQVSKELVPILNNLLAPPPFAYFPSSGRWALLIFGNVDLQINYLWQLQHKPINAQTFASNPSKGSAEDSASIAAPDGELDDTQHVLATATETSMKGSALGPDLFVKAVVSAYTAWLQREIVDGPIGQRIREGGKDSGSSRKRGTSKVLIAAALPPLVEDEVLPRIPEKYVERLEEDHAKRQEAMGKGDAESGPAERISKTPWARSKDTDPPVNDTLDGVSTLHISDDLDKGSDIRGRSQPETRDGQISPQSSSTESSNRSSMFDVSAMESSTHTTLTIPPSSPSARKSASSVDASDLAKDSGAKAESSKTSIEELLKYDPPLCTLPVRILMTNQYNRQLRTFCEAHPDIFSFIDITNAMLAGNYTSSPIGRADRSTWACPVDATNIHPLWEPTLPLWLEELKKVGVPTEGYRITVDAEETFRAYEADKRERTARQPWGKDGHAAAAAAADLSGTGDLEGGEKRRIKLRDE
ncbi:hypothetical protein BD324DRAFT_679998 [Kockovaella imperatae]|uniref:Uncharacterized protein n=1 Tax=Kockovaella imperatae TaxID=4999 RepID=A0A1Y1UL71_9TREE|nr:hypothetical protein BD324DRAFT_679998 [Kockovaella imperatae]ORX38244.1 hypothetical protein BD324DRAFT_679998 [Kockovaella imperatae]